MKDEDPSKVEIETTINAPAEDIWNFWTDESLILRWFGSDPNGKGLSASLEVRQHGSYKISFEDSDGAKHTCSGVYTEVLKPSSLSFSWKWVDEPENESFVSLHLLEVNNITHMHFEHRNLGSYSKHEYLKGWQRTFTKLDKVIKLKTESDTAS